MFIFPATIAVLAFLATYALGYSTYNSKTQICCNGTVTPRGDADSCCGQQPFEYGKFLCCGEQLFTIEEASSIDCCIDPDSGTVDVYDYTSQECCAGKVLDKPNKDAYYHCCDKELYDLKTHSCCGKTLRQWESDQHCCGDILFDIDSQVCCFVWDEDRYRWNHVTVDLVGTKSECCNGVAFDPDESICRDDQIVDFPEELEDIETSSHCGSVSYDNSKQICCTNWEGEAPNKLYTLMDIEGEKDSCCGYELYDADSEVCCDKNKSAVAKLPAEYDKNGYYTCCGELPESLVYNAYEKYCINGELVDLPGTDTLVCGNKTLNINTQTCCFGVVFDDDSSWDCCYSTRGLYNRDTDICCDEEDELVPRNESDISSGNDACCSALHY